MSTGARRAAAPVFTLAIFANAALIFALQPMFARMVTPLMGGSPAVWNTSMAFFQTALLLGYLYAHGLQRLRDVRVQGGVHMLVLLAGLIVQPIAVSGALGAPDATRPVMWTLGVLTLSVGLPFVAASATAPLLQAWYARSGRHDAHDPYYLYAASNLGSLIGLLGYPIFIEPLLGAHAQSQAWLGGYIGAAVLIGACALLVVAAQPSDAQTEAKVEPGARPLWRDRLLWMAAAAAPSSLLLGVTQHIATDVASAPFLWVAPLALYLMTFVIAFARGMDTTRWFGLLLHPVALAALVITFFWHREWGWALLANLASFFLSALICHQWLAARRPDAARVTEYFLWISAGGMIGGAVTALVAPVVFTGVYEYPLALAACALFRPRETQASSSVEDVSFVTGCVMVVCGAALAFRQADEIAIAAGGIGAAAAIIAGAWTVNTSGKLTSHQIALLGVSVTLAAVMIYVLAVPAALIRDGAPQGQPILVTPMRWFVMALSFLSFSLIAHAALQTSDRVSRIALGVAAPLILATLVFTLLDHDFDADRFSSLALGVIALAIFLNRERPAAMAVLILAAFATVFADDAYGKRIIHQARSFFGVIRVEELPTRSQESMLRILMNGTTIHGAQLTGPEVSRRPLTYYNPETALGESIIAGLAASEHGRLALVGLGSGSTACLMTSRDELTIFEIDENVVHLSTGPNAIFTYAPECQPHARIVVGDARLSLAREPDERFDVIVLDAFSSDAVPAHLLTREAVAMYLRKLSPTGVLVLHLSNRNLALVAEAARVAHDLGAGWKWRVSSGVNDPLAYGYGGLPASVMVVGRDQAVIDHLPFVSTEWRQFEVPPGRAWSDDYINLPRALWDSLTDREFCYTDPEIAQCGRAEPLPRAP